MFDAEKVRVLLLESLKQAGSYTRKTTGHGESSQGLFFSEEYGQLDRLLDFMVERERSIYNLSVINMEDVTDGEVADQS